MKVERRRTDSIAAAIAGLLAGAAFAAVLAADLRLTGRNVDDLVILGRPFTRHPIRARRIGLVVHALNSVALAEIYSRIEHRLPGPPWCRGLLFANLENLLLYPITIFEEWHPAVREGSVDRYRNWPAFWQSIPRHVAYGMVLGAAYDQLSKRGDAVRFDPLAMRASRPSARPSR
jgi:hypothetical protein